MKRPKLKKHQIVFLGIVLILCLPVYLFFSHDVSVLKDRYPHDVDKKAYFPVYEFRKEVPRNWTRLKRISTYARWAIILSEDWGFYQHQGIDVEQVKIALNEMASDKRYRGASTITQQMVKNVFLTQSRTLWRKLNEIILARKVERAIGKDRILEVYLNCIEMGPNIFGITQAARHYFQKHPSELRPREAAFIAMLLPSPKRYYSSFKAKKLTPFALSRVNAILIKMRMAHILTPEEYEVAKRERYAWEKYDSIPEDLPSEIMEDMLGGTPEDLPEEGAPEVSDEVSQALESDRGDNVREVEGADVVREHR